MASNSSFLGEKMSNQPTPGYREASEVREGKFSDSGQGAPDANSTHASESQNNVTIAKRAELGKNLMILAVALLGLNAALSIKVMDEYTGFFEAFMRVDNILNAIMIYGSPVLFIVGLVIWTQNRSK